MKDRRGALLAGLALLFLLAMGGLYLWALQSPAVSAPPPSPPRSLPGPAVNPALSSRPAPPAARPPPKVAIRPETKRPPPAEEDEDPTEEPDPLGPVTLQILVTDDRDEPLRRVPVTAAAPGQERGRRFVTDMEGRVTARMEAGEIVLIAERADGMLVTRSDPYVLDASEGGSWEVHLVVTSERTAGVGVSFVPVPEGKQVGGVHAGTPAEEAGLIEGDIITAVEGQPTAEMSNAEFVAQMTGLEGTKVLFDVLHADGSEERLQVKRALLDR